MKRKTKYIFLFLTLLLAGPIYELAADLTAESSMTAIVEVVEEPKDSVVTRFPVSPTIPEQYDDLNANYPIDLKNPEDFGDKFEYNPATNRYEIRSKVGGSDVTTPVSLTRDEYLDYTLKKSMNAYFKARNDEETSGEADKKKDALSPFGFNFDLGPAEKIFGPGGVRLQPHGSVNTKIGVSHTKVGDPTMTERNRNRWAFDFDPDIQVSANASIGDKMNFDLNYNTKSTFDYDSKKLKLAYAGKEDEIVKILEAGNVSMNTTNSLIRGGAALFGIKTQLQFGKLTVDAIFSQQNSQSRTTSSKGNVQTTPFEITVDNYDENMHFFLSHYFPAIYDTAMSKLPYIRSGILIDQIEVWVTNKRSNYDQARNIAAFADLGEADGFIWNENQVAPNPSQGLPPIPYNQTNDLYMYLLNETSLRNISQVNQTLEAKGFAGGQDYEKIENARKLDYSEYMLNSRLGYISLRMPLQPDEALAVAFSYQYNGKTYQVGEFSNQDPANPNNTLFLKLIKGTAQSPSSPGWHLMMKNVYTISKRGSLSSDKFRLDIKYQNDTTGVYLNYITEGKIANKRLLEVENLDRLNVRQEPYPDGFFDYVDSLTVFSQTGKIVFPVLQPFGEHLRNEIGNDDIAKKYVYQELYDTTLTAARQVAEKNKFILTGEYKGSSGSSIEAGGYNLAKGSVVVTANGVRLKENVDYTVNYSTGSVDIINPAYENANIQVSSEDQSGFGMQRKTMMGLNLNYAFSPKFNVGATLMNLSEMPMTMKVEPGQESINNTLFGFNTNYSTQSQWLTKMLDKLPFLELTAPSQITLNAEYAQLIPGHYKSQWGGDHSYVDDFERAKMSIDLRSPYSWTLSATPSKFPESKKTNNLEYGNNRALLAWYYIDGLFTRKSSLTPTHIKNDDEQLSNHYVREIREEELFPNKDVRYNEASTIPVLNLAYYPTERGPYNLDADGMNPDGTLKNPEKRWGGIFRKIESGNTDFEANNVEHIEFWLMDPFIYNQNVSGGDLYFNLGDVSEDILKDEKKFFENGIPVDGDTSKVVKTVWGYVPKTQSTVYAFDSQGENRKKQDVGFNGLSTEQEREYPAYKDYLELLRSKLEPSAYAKLEADPAGDNFHYFRGSDYDQMQTPILGRYKYYNGTEGNSANADDTSESYTTAAKINPDVEDINQDNTLNENEKYYQYKVSIRPNDLEVGRNFVVDKRVSRPKLKNGKSEEVTWYQFKIPIHSHNEVVGNIRDFQSIRFIRMFLTQFSDSTVLRFGTLELVRGEWRAYTKELNQPNMPPDPNTEISISTVNIEENGDKQPVNYIMPPGVNRMTDPGQPQLIMQNEQSLAAKVKDLATGDARAVYKNEHLDTRQYRRFQMFVHAENFENATDPVNDNEFSVFLRLGSDYKNNYYEYEIPLKITPPGNYNSASSNEREMVWPYANMFDFPFELLTNLKLKRNKEKRKAGSDVNYMTPFSDYDPQKPMNTITVTGNPTLSEIKVIMIGVRNNSKTKKSLEFWVDEMRLTEFNEDGGWAGNATLFVGLSDLGSINLAGRKETAGFGGLDQGIMERNLDDKQMISVSTQVELGKFFPEKAKVNIPFYYSYSEELVSPKYNPLDQDILLADALAAVETKAEKDSIRSFAVDRVMNRSIEFNNVRAGITSKVPMPYDPANFTFGYSFNESDVRNATTEYDRQTGHRVLLGYIYSPPLKPWKPFEKKNKPDDKNKTAKPTIGGSSKNNFLNEIQIGFLPKSIALNSDVNRNYYELQLRDIGNTGDAKLPVSHREDFYWSRTTAIAWDLTKNLRFNFNNGTQARIDAPNVQVNKDFNYDEYQRWKDSVLVSLRDLGTPINYNQQFSATWQLPFKAIPALNFLSADLKYDAQYNWERGAVIDIPDVEIGNKITNQRNMGVNNLAINFLTLYNKNKFLESANKKFTLNRPNNARNANQRNNRQTDDRAKKAADEKKNKKYEGEVTLNPDSATLLKHSLNNKRIRVTARGADGRLYAVNYKAIDANTIRINNKDSVKLKVNIAQLPPLDDLTWYKVAQVVARGLMMVRNVSVSYDLTQGMLIPGFRPEIGDFFGQGGTATGTAPGFDFAFGLNDESYLEKANVRDWLVKDQMSVTPALFNKTKTFRMTAVLEPFAGMKINLNANHISTAENQIDYMYAGMPKRFSGNFNMTTIALGSAFEKSDASNGYRSKAFNTFLENRNIIAQRLQNRYNQAIPGYNGGVEPNSTDVLIPAFLAAYTGGNARTSNLDFFPSLLRLLPNWKATYDGLIQIPFINKYFKTFSLEHEYKCNYRVGSYTSYPGWTSASDGIGYIQDMTGNSIATSPYNVMSVSIEEKFDPFIRINSVLLNNMTFKVDYKTGRNINLNIASYQIVEITSTEISANIGYRMDNFNKIIKFPKKTNPNFNNELRVSGGLSYRMSQSLNRKIQDGFTQPTTGNSQTMINLTADYTLSRMITLQAFFDRQVSRPLVSATSFPQAKSSFGVSVKVSLMQ
ncbi:MAG: cell surface protein SprA [Dysgonamonadaceae bacterium]|jgi:cell surface protein SprA|nr:cell surface protein SprA [Dysgonamonadaceae bacterium]